MNFEEMGQKAVNAEAKAGLKSSTIVQDSNIYCLRDYRLFNSIALKIRTLETIAKEFKPEESRPKELKSAEGKNPAPCRSKSTEPRKTFCIDKKKEYFKKKQDQKNNILATGDKANAVKIGEKKQNDQDNGRCYNCQKRVIFQKTARNFQKTSVGLGKLHIND